MLVYMDMYALLCAHISCVSRVMFACSLSENMFLHDFRFDQKPQQRLSRMSAGNMFALIPKRER